MSHNKHKTKSSSKTWWSDHSHWVLLYIAVESVSWAKAFALTASARSSLQDSACQ